MPVFDFDAEEQSDSRMGGPIPSGNYGVLITYVEWKRNKKGNGHNFEIQYQLLSGANRGYHFCQWYALDNPNPTACRIAKAKLCQIADCIGYDVPTNAEGSKLIDTDEIIKHFANQKLIIKYDYAKNAKAADSRQILAYYPATKKDIELGEYDDYKQEHPSVTSQRDPLDGPPTTGVSFDDDDIPF